MPSSLDNITKKISTKLDEIKDTFSSIIENIATDIRGARREPPLERKIIMQPITAEHPANQSNTAPHNTPANHTPEASLNFYAPDSTGAAERQIQNANSSSVNNLPMNSRVLQDNKFSYDDLAKQLQSTRDSFNEQLELSNAIRKDSTKYQAKINNRKNGNKHKI